MLRSGSVLLYFWCGGFVLQRDLPGARDTPFYVQLPLVYFFGPLAKSCKRKNSIGKGPSLNKKLNVGKDLASDYVLDGSPFCF